MTINDEIEIIPFIQNFLNLTTDHYGVSQSRKLICGCFEEYSPTESDSAKDAMCHNIALFGLAWPSPHVKRQKERIDGNLKYSHHGWKIWLSNVAFFIPVI